MLDATAHMLMLLQQAQIKNERPQDDSFLPLSLSLACLLRQLPPGLAPPSGVLSFHQLDRLPTHILEHKVEKLLHDGDSSKVFNFVYSIVAYTKIARALLGVCHEHLVDKKSSLEATQSIVDIIASARGGEEEQAQEGIDEGAEEPSQRKSTMNRPSEKGRRSSDDLVAPSLQKKESRVNKTATSHAARAVDPSMIIKRALSRDIGDGSAVLEIMRKYPGDERIQSRGVRALKSVVRKFASAPESSAEAMTNADREGTKPASTHPNQQRSLGNRSVMVGSDDSSSGDDGVDVDKGKTIDEVESESAKSMREAILHVISNMKKHPDMLPLQREGLLCLSEYVSKDVEDHVAVITSHGGIASIMDAMAKLPDDQEAHVGGLSVLAHPQIAHASVVRVNPESRRLVLSAMKRFPLNEQIQGLSCLALANLSLRHDESMLEIVVKGGLETVVAAMKRFPGSSLVQAAGCWLIGIVSAKDEEMMTSCLDAGALPVCEKARVAFPSDSKVQQHALFAIHHMAPDEAQEQERGGQGQQASRECALQ